MRRKKRSTVQIGVWRLNGLNTRYLALRHCSLIFEIKIEKNSSYDAGWNFNN